ncbi:MAG: hypothetical protein KAS72_04225 [Phycisphaerales bacterium]|nr:hypothetical protein [Phycisphaerales bacterium]
MALPKGMSLAQLVLIGSTIVLSWLGMQVVHELGHVLGALATGGRISAVVLNPLEFSRTDLAVNPHPLVVAWCGAVLGSAIPALIAVACRFLHAQGLYVVLFFTGFCLIVNGLYLGVGSFMHAGDAGDLLCYGAAPWQLWLFGAITVPPGFILWNGLGPSFGLASSHGRVNARVAYTTAAIAGLLLIAEFAYTWA